ncbi:MAG: PSD1 and planctomycete cytochrome C domain-containing protein [Bryobacteraceae bacterium]
MFRVALFATLSFVMAAQTPEAAARRVLESRCLSCHGSAKMSGLDLRKRETMLSGGSRGAAIVPGKAAESLLYKAASREGKLAMPPGKQALDAKEVDALRAWIDAGAPWGDAAAKEQSWWAFRKPAKPAIPSGARNPIDALLGSAEPAAGRRTLIRRLTFDIHGLPPDPEEVDRFVKDTSPDAYAKLVDRLLESPRYGERWGRHWLDVVRYADTGGYETDVYLHSAWRYRDWVIRSFNQDKPYDTFLQEQIAADEIWPDNLELNGSYNLPESKKANLEKRLGTGLFTLGALPVENSFFGDQYRAEWQNEAIDMIGSAFLGLTMGCARCHDHKFDPIQQRDYYRLASLFAGSEDREVPIASQMAIFEYTRYQTKQVAVDDLRAQYERLKPDDKDGRETLLRKIGEAYVKTPKMYAKANLLAHVAPVPDTYVLQRGDWRNKGEKVTPGFPAALGPAPEIEEPANPWFVPRRRKALAEWIASREHPLTARVMVNRVWGWYFGRGIVATPNDFGRQGEPPSNQALLDYLAVDFQEKGWSFKKLHRLILNSDAYKARRGPQRLDAESIRDSVLSVAGALNTKMGGKPVVPALASDERDGMRDMSQWPVTPDAKEHDRRSVYMFVKRSFRLPMMETFDAPDPVESCSRRETSTVAPQALALMNSEFMAAQAKRFAARVAKAADPVDAAWRLALARSPSVDEKRKAADYLAKNPLDRLCLMLLNMSEFVYVD